MDSSYTSLMQGDYEVFLSFRGADTRQGFIDVLYECMTTAEIRVFRDDDELRIGDKIDSIFEAINNSKICIPIFSPKFAESKWCLSEVAKMVELKKTIVPVFYNVTSDDVKLKGSSVYSRDLHTLEKKYGNHQVQIWKNSLKEVVSNKGRTLGVKGYTKFCKELVDEVLSKLGPRKRLEIDYFVGDANKATTMHLLDMAAGSSSQEVLYIGIYGMGGIGKTTLTKLIHNELLPSFDHCGFVPDIREFSKCNGINALPRYLYDNIEPKSVAEFSQSRQIPNIFKNKKVLLILDDVDICEQIKEIAREPSWFGLGSRIIVTTRDKEVLHDYEKESGIKMRYLEMEGLNSSWSLELFSKCAFRNDSPPPSYQDLSKRVVAYAGGLPLAVIVIGKLLHRYKTLGDWEEFIERLDKNPPKEVKDRLLISYQALEEDKKRIFLDIACLFIGEEYTETSNIFYMWKACDLYPRLSIEVLQSRCLVKIDKYNKLRMHDQLRDFGRELVRAKSGGDVMKQSKLWEHNQVMEVLRCKKKMKENIEEVKFPEPNVGDEDFIDEELRSFDNLKYLALGRRSLLQGDFSNLLPKLIWLQCCWILEARNLVPSNLVILDLSKSDITENWHGWSQIQVLKKLKVLDLSNCFNLGTTPVFADQMALERLLLYGCSGLTYIDSSIAKLKHLNYLTLSGCTSLNELPGESLGELHALKELNLKSTGITSLPDSIGRLEELECLNLNCCKHLVDLPGTLGKLRSLVHLDIEGTKITRLPSSIEGLEKLQKFTLSSTQVSQLPCSISHLSQLQSLKLYECNQLQELPNLPNRLMELCVESNVLTKVADLSNLHNLAYLSIAGGGTMLDWNGSFPSNCKLQTLTLEVVNISKLPGLTNCSKLTHLRLKCIHSLKMLPDISSLRELVLLVIESCKNLEELPGMKKLQCLTYLYIMDCPSLKGLENLTELQALREIELIGCGKLTKIPGLGELLGLTKLKIENCDSLGRLDNLAALKELKEFCLVGCQQLTEIPGLGELQYLTSLRISNCSSLLTLENVHELHHLKHFTLDGCQNLAEISGVGKLRCSTIIVREDCDSYVIFAKKEEEEAEEVKEEEEEEVFCELERSSLTRSSVLVLDSDESVMSFDGSRSFPISQLEGKVVGLYFAFPWSLQCIDFTLELLDVYEKLKKGTPETSIEIVCVQRDVDPQSIWESFGANIPWISLRVNRMKIYENLFAYFKVTILPALVIIGSDGRVLNFNAVDMIKQQGAIAYPFTLEKHVNSNEVNGELFREANMIWPNELQHHMHVHQLVRAIRWNYICNGCNQDGELWSYCCEKCDFDLHSQCATLNNLLFKDTAKNKSSKIRRAVVKVGRKMCMPNFWT